MSPPQELQNSLVDCREVNNMIAGGGDTQRRKQLEDDLAKVVSDMRRQAAALQADLQAAAAQRGGYVTFQVKVV